MVPELIDISSAKNRGKKSTRVWFNIIPWRFSARLVSYQEARQDARTHNQTISNSREALYSERAASLSLLTD